MSLTDDEYLAAIRATAWTRHPFSPTCDSCRHLIFPMRCGAFERIPLEIWLGDNNHQLPYANDQGIQYERGPNEFHGDDAL